MLLTLLLLNCDVAGSKLGLGGRLLSPPRLLPNEPCPCPCGRGELVDDGDAEVVVGAAEIEGSRVEPNCFAPAPAAR